MTIISNTYSDEDMVKDFIDDDLYDSSTLSANIAKKAAHARDRVNNYLGRQSNFTTAELAEVDNKGIVLAASMLTAYYLEKEYQERQGRLAEETKSDYAEAFEILAQWMLNHGMTPPGKGSATASVPRDILIVYAEEEYSIGGT